MSSTKVLSKGVLAVSLCAHVLFISSQARYKRGVCPWCLSRWLVFT